MLEADEIIQQKEWHELAADEKEIIAELADNEAEYNLLKKMLLLSSDAGTEVPDVSRTVYQNITDTLPENKKRKRGAYWLAAAAAVVVVLSILFIFQKEDHPAFVKTPEKPIEVKPIVKEIVPAKEDSAPQIVENKRVKKSSLKVPVKNKTAFPSLQNDDPKNYVAVNVSVSDNASLLDLVAEVE